MRADKDLLSANGLCRKLGIEKRTLRGWLEAGYEVPRFVDPVSGRVRYPVQAVEKWLASFADRKAS